MSSPTALLFCDENFCNLDIEDEAASVGECDEEEEYIKVLLDRETSNGGHQMQGFLHTSWFQTARLKGIYYILRKREVLGFGLETAYASVTYLDRFLAGIHMNVEKSWAVRLLSMACLSLAAKMEETRVPALSEFSLEDYNFGSSVIQKMELLVLNTLGWRMGSLSPFNFVKFFANRFCYNSPPPNGFSTTVELILIRSITDAKIMCCYRPSVIAAAATLIVLDQGLSKDSLQLKIGCLKSTNSFQTESIISCYKLLHEMDIGSLNMSQVIAETDEVANRKQDP